MKPVILATILGIVGTITYLYIKGTGLVKKTKPSPTVVVIDLEKPVLKVETVPFDSIKQSEEILPESLSAPYDKLGFGIDSHRNTDEHEIDDYLNLPLVGEGKTYLNSSLADVDSVANSTHANKAIKYKYIRLHVLETRGDSPTVSLGQIEFYRGSDIIKMDNISIWNPHTGSTEPYKGSWSDSDMKTIIFVFTPPTQITRYIMKTSSMPPMHDPSMWDLEGSKNGSYWTPIHTVDMELPVLRGKTMYFLIN